MLQLPAHPVTDHRAADIAADDKPGANRLVSARVRVSEMDDESPATGAATAPHRGGEVWTPPQSGRGRQHGKIRIRRRQAERT